LIFGVAKRGARKPNGQRSTRPLFTAHLTVPSLDPLADDCRALVESRRQLLERNSGCIQYIVSTSDEPEAVWVCEVWTNVAAHDASLEPEDIQALIQEARPLIAGMSDQTQLTVQGGKACLAETATLNVVPMTGEQIGQVENHSYRVADG
jgi:quinol monooxygenase YgiN